MSFGVVGMSLAFAVAGVLQSYLERYRGEPYIVAQEPMRLWMFIVLAHGLFALAGAFLVIRDLLTLRPAAAGAEPTALPERLRVGGA
jgi:nitric oxide reductase subunit B